MQLQGKVAVVTGGASGIGRGLARRLAREGVRVAVADVNAEGVEAVAAETGGVGLAADMASESDVQRLVEQVEAALGPIDLFCSNAGVSSLGGVEAPDEAWRRSIDVNLMAHVYAARALLPSWLERGRGYLLVTASAAGLLTQLGSAPYSATKHAAVALAEWIAITHGDAGVTVSVLCPQGVRTAMTAPLLGDESDNVIAVDGMLEPEDVAESTIEAIEAERFLVLPHPEVEEYFQRKANDYDRWLAGMRRLQARLAGMP